MRYFQKFTLTDIFNNKKLAGKLPLINYKEVMRENGGISRRTNAKSVNRLVFDISVKSARPYYKPLKATRSGDNMFIGGNLVKDHNEAVNAIYNAILAQKQLISLTANNMDMIRNALKEGQRNIERYGATSKLYLKINSMQEIENMNRSQINGLINDIMANIMYGDDFPKTQAKWNVEKNINNYERKKQEWKRKVRI